MLKTYFILAFRNLFRNKEYFLINVFGLAIGMSCTILVLLVLREEANFDSFHPASDRIYRLYIHSKLGGIESKAAVTSQRFAFGVQKEIPEIEQACRVFKIDRNIGLKSMKEEYLPGSKLLFADSTFFDLFGFKLLEGDPVNCLSEPKSIVLTTSLANHLFPDGAMGKKLILENKQEWEVTGILEDTPKNSHLRFSALISLNTLVLQDTSWTTNFLYTYYRFRPGTDLESKDHGSFQDLTRMEQRFVDFFTKIAAKEIETGFGIPLSEFNSGENYFVLRLQNICDIHLFSNLKYEISRNVNFQTMLIVSGIAFLILMIACINYANLTTARLASRVREIGVRKVFGSQRMQLAIQFISESVVISFVSLFLSLSIVELLLPRLQNSISFDINELHLMVMQLLPGIFIFTLIIGIIAGSYPAIYISKYTPSEIFRREKKLGAGGKNFRQMLLILQFVFSIVIIYSTSTIYRQLQFIKTKETGFDKDQILVLQNNGSWEDDSDKLVNYLNRQEQIESFSFSESVPGKRLPMHSLITDMQSRQIVMMSLLICDPSFFKTLGLKYIRGNANDSLNSRNDTIDIVINEAASRFLVGDPIGQFFYQIDVSGKVTKFKVRGVVKNFNYESLHTEIQPLIFVAFPDNISRFLTIRFKEERALNTKDLFIAKLKKSTGMNSITAFSMNENVESFYIEEYVTGNVALYFSFFAIFIASLGLYSLLALTTQARTSEIGVRKVLGASTFGLVKMLTSEIVQLILLSGLIAMPLSFFISSYWLDRFAYHVPLSFSNYLLIFACVLFIALFTIYRQLLRTVKAVPAEALRTER